MGYFKADESKKHTVAINNVLMCHDNEEAIKIMRDKHIKLSLRRAVGNSYLILDDMFHCNVRESSFVCLHDTARIKEIPACSQFKELFALLWKLLH